MCAICFKDTHPQEQKTLVCKHVFCVSCINKWTQSGNNTCPLCRSTYGTFQVASRIIDMNETLKSRWQRLRRIGDIPPISPEWNLAFQYL